MRVATQSNEPAAVEVVASDRTVEVTGGLVFVRTWTPSGTLAADEPPIVLLHDSLGSVELWRDFPAALAGRLGRRVIAYDRLGFGRSTPRTEPIAMSFIRDEAERAFPELREALGLEDYVLFGHSVGGVMSLLVAATGREPVIAVVSESAQPFVEERTREGIRRAQRGFAEPDQFARLTRWHGERAAWVLASWTDTWLSPAFDRWTIADELPRVRCPVLVIHGDQDEYGSVAFPELIGARVGGPVEVAVLPGCGHVPHRERQDEVVDRGARFLAANGANSAAATIGHH